MADRRQSRRDGARAAFIADPDNAVVPDPFRRGRLCRRWMTGVHPDRRVEVGVQRGVFRSVAEESEE